MHAPQGTAGATHTLKSSEYSGSSASRVSGSEPTAPAAAEAVDGGAGAAAAFATEAAAETEAAAATAEAWCGPGGAARDHARVALRQLAQRPDLEGADEGLVVVLVGVRHQRGVLEHGVDLVRHNLQHVPVHLAVLSAKASGILEHSVNLVRHNLRNGSHGSAVLSTRASSNLQHVQCSGK